MNTKKVFIPNTPVGGIFEVAGIEFIKFPEVEGKVPAVTKDILFNSRFGNSNDLRNSDVLKKLEKEYLPKIIEAVGEENLHVIRTDLTTLDGLKPYGELESMISLPTMDFYRKYVEIFDEHKVRSWWWLATPESAKPHYEPNWILCVTPSGNVNYDSCNYGNGVRPVLLFESSIFESSGVEE